MIRASLGTVLGLLAAVAPTAAAEIAKPKVLAFVVGIESYDNQELDALQYAADDARAVYAQLGVVADLDPASVLLVADDEATAEEERRVTAQQLRDALETFVPKIKDRANIVVYLGGHGTLSSAEKLRYLPSDYDPNGPSRFLQFDNILDYFKDRINGNGLRETSVTFLVNMCGAGNAALAGEGRHMGVDDNPRLVEKARQMFLEGQFGFQRYAILPATPKDRNAFERDDLGRSEFAHYLLAGLSGPAAREDSALTARALFDHLDQALGGELPWSDDYAGDIVLGRTGALEGEAHYLVGTGLLAAALTIEPGQGGTLLDIEIKEHAAQADLLYDLARDQLGRVDGRNSDLAPRAQLRLEQALLASGGTADKAKLEPLAESSKLDARERQEARALTDSATDGPAFPTLKSFRDHLESGTKVYVALLRDADSATIDDARAWADMIQSFSDIAAIKQFGLDLSAGPGTFANIPELRQTLLQWRATADQQPGVPSHLIVIYTGRADVSSATSGRRAQLDPRSHHCLQPDPDPLCRIVPVNQDLIIAVQELWQAPLTFFFDAPFGGFLLDRPPKRTHPISLLVAARERNGMTFSGSSGSTSRLLARAFRDGVEDPGTFGPLVDFQQAAWQEPSSADLPYVPGTAAWVPNWGTPDAKPVLAGHLAPLGRFALHVAAGCAERAFAECDSVPGVGPAADGKDVFDRLTEAAGHDLARHASQAANAYDVVSAALRGAPMRADDVPGRPSGISLAEEARSTLLQSVERRASGALSKVGRRVLLLPVGIEDYTSPLVADLPHVASDLAAYDAVLRRMLSGSPGGTPDTTVEPPPSNCGVLKDGVLQFKTAPELIDCLKKAASGLHEQDLLLLIFSGRGVEIEGRRYLAMAGTRAASALGPTTQTSQTSLSDGQGLSWGRDTGLVDLEDLAAAAAGRWFVGIYDAQFTQPALDAARSDQLLDKHVDSVRPRPTDAAQARIEEGLNIRSLITAFPQSRGGLPPLQVHVWLEGRLTQNAATPLPCLAGQADTLAVASPLAAAILRTMPAQTAGTYRDWLHALAADACLQRAGEWATVVFQGDLDVPLLASGEGAQFVDYFYDSAARHDLNLRVAQELAKEVANRFPAGRNRLARAALLVTLAQLHGEDAELHGFLDDRDGWLAEAIRLLEQLNLEDFQRDAFSEAERKAILDLWAIRLELLSRAYGLRNRSDEAALRVLRDAQPAAVLDQRDLAQRLVSLSGEFLRRDPGVVLGFARAKLLELGAQGGTPAAAMAELEALIRTERARRREPFRITGVDSGSTGGAW